MSPTTALGSSGDEEASTNTSHENTDAPDIDGKLQQVSNRIDALEQPSRTGAETQTEQLARIESKIEMEHIEMDRISELLERATVASQVAVGLWIRVPVIIGGVVMPFGIVLLLTAFALRGPRFDTALWGGVVLIGLGASLATALVLAFAKPSIDDSKAKRPSMRRLGQQFMTPTPVPAVPPMIRGFQTPCLSPSLR